MAWLFLLHILLKTRPSSLRPVYCIFRSSVIETLACSISLYISYSILLKTRPSSLRPVYCIFRSSIIVTWACSISLFISYTILLKTRPSSVRPVYWIFSFFIITFINLWIWFTYWFIISSKSDAGNFFSISTLIIVYF